MGCSNRILKFGAKVQLFFHIRKFFGIFFKKNHLHAEHLFTAVSGQLICSLQAADRLKPMQSQCEKNALGSVFFCIYQKIVVPLQRDFFKQDTYEKNTARLDGIDAAGRYC